MGEAKRRKRLPCICGTGQPAGDCCWTAHGYHKKPVVVDLHNTGLTGKHDRCYMSATGACDTKMNRHDLKSMSAELPWSVDDFVAFNRVQAATHMVEFWAQEQRLKHLNEYCDKAVAEIRASLDRTQGNQAR
jgi:hypothetical protein